MPRIVLKDIFERKLHNDGLKIYIESRCRNCGTTIIGSVDESLLQDEEQHARECSQSIHIES
jgi:hypothetical protein